MANRPELPREKKMKDKIETLEESLLTANETIIDLRQMLDSCYAEMKHMRSYINKLQEENTDLLDFKKITRLMLPHIQAVPIQMMAVNSSNKES